MPRHFESHASVRSTTHLRAGCCFGPGVVMHDTVRLHRYWFRFADPSGEEERRIEERSYDAARRLVRRFGCGVTAWTEEDALRFVRSEIFDDEPLPEIESVVEGIDLRTFELPRPFSPFDLPPPNLRGIWFPPFYCAWWAWHSPY
jgi:hypothetical protein